MWDTIVQALDDLNIWSILVRSLLAVLIGGALGIERRFKNRAAGFRTYILVCLGSTLTAMTGIFFAGLYNMPDPTRIAAQVISGIGFLGAGTIIITRERKVEGLTTASGLWVVAAIGVALGAGFYSGGILVGLLVIVTFTVLENVEDYLVSSRHEEDFYVELVNLQALPAFLDFLTEQGYKPREQAIKKAHKPETERIGMDIRLALPHSKTAHDVLRAVSIYPDLVYITFDMD